MEQLTTRQKSISTMLQTGHAPNSCSEQRTRLIKSLTQDLAQSWDKGTTPTTTQCPQPTASLSTHKNSNRTTSTITNPTINNGTPVTTTYCYNNADQLISSSLVAIGTPEYDDHGNTTKLGAGTTQQLEFTYDATDKNTQILQINPTTANGQVSQYERDVQGRITKRKTFTITNSNWNQTNETTYGFTGAGDTPDFTRDNTNTITEKYLQLPGVRPRFSGSF